VPGGRRDFNYQQRAFRRLGNFPRLAGQPDKHAFNYFRRFSRTKIAATGEVSPRVKGGNAARQVHTHTPRIQHTHYNTLL
jgi:hypothetical protein